jgi:ethanolamine-phosphate cytidylyltransferase
MNNEKRYFIDGCFDGYHYGHVNAIFQSKILCDQLIIGTHTDDEIITHKNMPLFNYNDRIFMIKNCKYIDEYIGEVPYIVNVDTIYKYNCSKYLHGKEIIKTKNGENGINVPAECYITYDVTHGISTSNLILRIYQFFNNLTIETNNNTEYLLSIINNMKKYNIRKKLTTKKNEGNDTTTVYIIDSWDLLCVEHVRTINLIKNEYRTANIVAVIKNNADKNIYNELERSIILHSLKALDNVVIIKDNESIIENNTDITIDLFDETYKNKYFFTFDKYKYVSNIMDNFDNYKSKIMKFL